VILFLIFAIMKHSEFTQLLMQWHMQKNTRQMPWKGEKDPYKIWLSEVILQQTRVEQGWSYYEKFIKAYPTLAKLANAKDEEVFKLWEGLGYYNRCKNLLYTARFIEKELNGVFPDEYEKILSLKGVGPYTASAIASFAFNKPYAVVDGNVFRVLSRWFGIDTAIDSAEGIKIFTSLAGKLIDKKNAGLYNQAIMDFGATVCKPALPLCSACDLQENCVAHEKRLVNHLPVKEKLLQRKNRWFTWFLFTHRNKIFVTKRTGKDIWQNLFEFYLVETDEKTEWQTDTINEVLKNQLSIANADIVHISPVFSQQLTHQNIKAVFIKIELSSVPVSLESYTCIGFNDIGKFAFPGIINQYLQSASMQSTLF